MNFDRDLINYSPQSIYFDAQKNILDNVEGIHSQEPDKTSLIIAGGLTLVEAGAAFFLLQSAGLLIAFIGALFPGFLLWAMANYHADQVELPKKAEELEKLYDESI
jgi:hypothetical protein